MHSHPSGAAMGSAVTTGCQYGYGISEVTLFVHAHDALPHARA